MPINFTSKGSWQDSQDWLKKMSDGDIFDSLTKYGSMGVEALSSATPVETGLASESWRFEVKKSDGSWSIYWYNDDVDKAGQPIVILLQYGHGTRTGGYVQGRDFIMPAITPIFDQIANDVWKVVTD